MPQAFSAAGYEIKKRIYLGSRTRVYRAVRKRDDLPVIIKTAALEVPDVGEVRRLKREYTLGNMINHKGVVRYHHLEILKETPALILEDFGGESLKQEIPLEGLDTSSFLNYAVQISAALVAVHEKGIIHKDIKPANILLNPDSGMIKIADFGIASELNEEYRTESGLNKLEGTLAYISPEQTGRMNRPVDYRTDFYSLGVTFFEMLTGKLPFSAEDPLEMVHGHIARQPPSPRDTNPNILTQLERIVLKLMAKDAQERYQSASGLHTDLTRCIQEWQEQQFISPFTLGSGDFSGHFQIPHKLYGREEETTRLIDAFTRVAGGEREMMVITGFAGIGKSALVHEVLKPVTTHRGFFISGKFDQIHRNIPYSGLTPAFSSLVRQILGESDEVVAKWRDRLKSSLGKNAGVLTGVIPDLALILGEEVEEDIFEAVDPRMRFRLVFRDFLSTFTSAEHPLVLFLDDLQWADASSLDLLDLMFSDTVVSHLLVIAAYRDNEVKEGDQVSLTLSNIINKDFMVETIQLNPLSISHLALLVRDTLRCPLEEAKQLAACIHKKTHGNPFFSFELMRDLHRKGLLSMDIENRRWRWDQDLVDDIKVSENVVSFLETRIRTLPKATQAILKQASCIGAYFKLTTLAKIMQTSPARCAADLWPALRENIVIPMDDAYRLLEPSPDSRDLSMGDLEVTYRFQHDRVHQAAYSLIDPSEQEETHLFIGRTLLKDWDETEDPDHLIDLTHHLNAGRALIKTKTEQLQLAELNLRCGKKALASIAYKTGYDFLQIAADLLTDDAWTNHYHFSFDLYMALAETAYLCGRGEDAEVYCRLLLENGRADLEKTAVYELQMVHYTTVHRMHEAIEAGLQGLALLGVQLSKKPNKFSILSEGARIRWQMGTTAPLELVERQPITDPKIRATLNLLMRLALPCYLSRSQELYATSILKRVNLSLRHGNSPESAHAFATYGLFMSAFRGQYEDGYAFGQLALELNERLKYPPLRSKVFFLYGLFIHPWVNHWRTMEPWLEKAIEAGHQSGDLLYSSMAAVQKSMWIPYPDLDTAVKTAHHALAWLRDSSYPYIWEQAAFVQQFRFALMGKTKTQTSFSDETFDETGILPRLEQEDQIASIVVYHLHKAWLAFLFQRLEMAQTHIDQAVRLKESTQGTPAEVEGVFLGFLITAANLDEPPNKAQNKRFKRWLKQMQTWEASSRENFKHRRLLMEAELARLNGQNHEAAVSYQKAADEAKRNVYRLHEAMITEAAARFYERCGQSRIASIFYTDASRCYARYGASAKVAQIQTRPDVITLGNFYEPTTQVVNPTLEVSLTATESSFSMSSNTRTTGRNDQILDLATVVKSSLAISSVMDYEKLIEKIMEIIIESAGAQRGVLILREGEDLLIKAVINAERQTICLESRKLDQSTDVPRKLIRYTYRKGRTVVSHDAASDPNYNNDLYLRRNNVKSVLCTPMRHKDQAAGVLYLENNLIDHVFTEDRVELLHLLFSQAAISLENARLLAESRETEQEMRNLNRRLEDLNADLERRVRERTAELKRARDELVEQAHHSGMADIATSVLHNVGNILNSVLTSCQLIQDTLGSSKMEGLLKANTLLRMHMDDLDHFITENPKGKDLMRYYLRLDDVYLREKERLSDNVQRLAEKIDSIREVIREQQAHATRGFQSEEIALEELVEEALNLLGTSLSRHDIEIETNIGKDLPLLFLPKNKLLHLLLNLFKNAKEAMLGTPHDQRLLIVKGDLLNDRIAIRIKDSGEGIPADNLDQIFKFGFTTKKNGHGFGLHTCANAMTEMGGTIFVESEGHNQGATFVLDLPVTKKPSPVAKP